MSKATDLTPGSEAAYAEGCQCPLLDNNRGYSPPVPPDGWVINEDCPIHDIDFRHDGGQPPLPVEEEAAEPKKRGRVSKRTS